jgi:hypothetical protein
METLNGGIFRSELCRWDDRRRSNLDEEHIILSVRFCRDCLLEAEGIHDEPGIIDKAIWE